MSRDIQAKESGTRSRLVELRPDLYRAIFESSSEPIVILDPQGFYLDQNAAHLALLGYSDEDLKNQTPAIHMGEKLFAEVMAELAATGAYRAEVINITKDGEPRYVELTAFVMRDEAG